MIANDPMLSVYIVVKGNFEDFRKAVCAHGLAFVKQLKVHKDCGWISGWTDVVTSDGAIFAQWMAEDVGQGPPFPPGSLLCYRVTYHE